MFAKISKKVVAVALVAAMAVTTATVASDNTASAAMKKKATVYQGKQITLNAGKSATWTSSNDQIAHCMKKSGKSIKIWGIKAGKATIEGFDKDSYKLKEVVSPEGYNKLTSPVEFSVNGKTNDIIERTRVNVINYTGSELPETGGIGTKLFITSGLSLVLICGLVLVTKLRLYKNI